METGRSGRAVKHIGGLGGAGCFQKDKSEDIRQDSGNRRSEEFQTERSFLRLSEV